MKLGRFSLFSLLLCCGAWTVGASVLEEAPHTVTAKLVAEHLSIRPGGSTRVGIVFTIEPGWHIYADPSGDAGLPTKITWSGPGMVSFSPLPWPIPERFQDPGDITTYGYTGLVMLPARMQLTDFTKQIEGAYDLPVPGEIKIAAHVKWLACKQICVPGSADLSETMPVDYDGKSPTLSPHARLFEPIK